MNKLSALSKLASAYHDQLAQSNLLPVAVEDDKVALGNRIAKANALSVLSHTFHDIRSSLVLADLAPQPKAVAPIVVPTPEAVPQNSAPIEVVPEASPKSEGLNGPMPRYF